METITVSIGENSYPIFISENILPQLGSYVKERVSGRKLLLVSNPTVYNLYGKVVNKSLQDAGYEVLPGIIPDGEIYKSLDTARDLYDIAFEGQLDRKCAVVALGGGVVGDLAGFIAATYMRGIPFIQVPTTLLAQVDSSVGGKVAVNHPKGKNIIGAFYQPKMVFTDIATLRTLPEREFRAGMAEVIKYGVIWDKEFFSYLEKNISDIKSLDIRKIIHIVKISCSIKAQVVAKDEREENLRAILNYGHTFGHAYEALTGYNMYLHGEGVAIGMISAAILAGQLGLLGEEAVDAIKRLIVDYELPVNFTGLSVEKIINKMYHDKKVEQGKIRYILPKKIGQVDIFSDIDEKLIEKALSSQF